LLAGFFVIFLPETNGYPMPANKADLKRMYKRLPPVDNFTNSSEMPLEKVEGNGNYQEQLMLDTA